MSTVKKNNFLGYVFILFLLK